MTKGLRWNTTRWDLFQKGTPICYWYKGKKQELVCFGALSREEVHERPRIKALKDGFLIDLNPRYCRIDVSKPEGKKRTKEWKKHNRHG